MADGPTPRERMEAGYARAEQRNREARAKLEPLGPGERPTAITVGAVLTGLVALSILVAYLAGIEVDGEKPEIVQALAPMLLTGLISWGLWRARYWAAVCFQLLLVFLIFSSVFALALQVTTVAEVAIALGMLAVSGTLFFHMVKAMARLQMPDRPE